MELDRESSVPLYHQLLEIFVQFLADGTWPIGKRIPTETELSIQYGVSKITIKQALSILVQEGRIERRPGSGTFVTHPKYEYIMPTSSGFCEYFPAGNKVRIEVLEWKKVKTTEDIAKNLHCDPHDQVSLLRRLVFSGTTPIVYQSLFYIGTPLSQKNIQQVSLLQAFEGITNLEETWEPVSLDVYESELFQLHTGTPAIKIERTALSTGKTLAFERSLLARGKIKLDRFILTTGYLEVPESASP